MALTLLTAGGVVLKGDTPLLRAIVLVLAQLCIYQTLKGGVDLWNPLVNQLVDLLFLFFCYTNWFYSRRSFFLSLTVIFVVRVIWHSIGAMIEIHPLRYAEGNNALYLLELAAICVGIFQYRKDN